MYVQEYGRRKVEYNGVVLLNKPEGPTSHDIVMKMRRIFNTKKVGHTGTLDPMATGLMVILIGKATKASAPTPSILRLFTLPS